MVHKLPRTSLVNSADTILTASGSVPPPLPLDIVFDVIRVVLVWELQYGSRIYYKALTTLRRVCKTWNNLIQERKSLRAVIPVNSRVTRGFLIRRLQDIENTPLDMRFEVSFDSRMADLALSYKHLWKTVHLDFDFNRPLNFNRMFAEPLPMLRRLTATVDREEGRNLLVMLGSAALPNLKELRLLGEVDIASGVSTHSFQYLSSLSIHVSGRFAAPTSYQISLLLTANPQLHHLSLIHDVAEVVADYAGGDASPIPMPNLRDLTILIKGLVPCYLLRRLRLPRCHFINMIYTEAADVEEKEARCMSIAPLATRLRELLAETSSLYLRCRMDLDKQPVWLLTNTADGQKAGAKVYVRVKGTEARHPFETVVSLLARLPAVAPLTILDISAWDARKAHYLLRLSNLQRLDIDIQRCPRLWIFLLRGAEPDFPYLRLLFMKIRFVVGRQSIEDSLQKTILDQVTNPDAVISTRIQVDLLELRAICGGSPPHLERSMTRDIKTKLNCKRYMLTTSSSNE